VPQSSKRQRQKQGRVAQQMAAREAARRRQRQKRGRYVAVAVLLAGIMMLFAVFSEQADRDTDLTAQGSEPDATTTTTNELEADCPAADGSSAKKTRFRRAPEFCIDKTKLYRAQVETDVGTFEITLDAQKAPETVNNFVFLSRYHFYDGLPFHRAKPGFGIQSGNPTEEGVTDAGYTIPKELPKPNEYRVGTVIMASSGDHSHSTQFVVLTGPEGEKIPHEFAIFGRVTSGMEVIRQIESDGSPDFKPKKLHVMRKVTIVEI
jgi:cyclophilin family peptidyl-prolyl cis-trans isomerase